MGTISPSLEILPKCKKDLNLLTSYPCVPLCLCLLCSVDANIAPYLPFPIR